MSVSWALVAATKRATETREVESDFMVDREESDELAEGVGRREIGRAHV